MIHKRHRSDCRCWAHRSTEKWPECEWWLFVALRIRMYSINIDSWLRNGSFRLHSNQNTLPDVTHIIAHRYAVLAYGFKLRNLCFGFTLISILSRWCHDVMTLFLTASFLTNFTTFSCFFLPLILTLISFLAFWSQFQSNSDFSSTFSGLFCCPYCPLEKLK